MNSEELLRLAAAGFHRVPLVRTVVADLETALSVYLKLASGPYSYLFESVQGGEKWGRYSIIGLPCREVIRVRGEAIEVERDGKVEESATRRDPLAWIEDYRQSLKVAEPPGLPRFYGGLVGYFGYDTVRYAEPRLAGVEKPDALGDPDILLLRSEEVAVFDNLRGKLHLVVHVDPREADALAEGEARLDGLEEQLGEPLIWPAPTVAEHGIDEGDFISGFTREGYEAAVDRARRYIVDGDIMQVVLSQRLSTPLEARPVDVYRALRTLNPSPYMYFLDLGETHVVGSSPEILVRLEEDEVTVRPIAGTRPRGADEAADAALAEELLADPKERAEHLMLID
ncbi:MAG: chorismate-binding protein, partial [Thiohalospira sp.]